MSILTGIRVLDFGRYIAAPYCAALLSQLGAEVIRIERPEGNEDRFLMPVSETGDGAMFLQLNAGKLGMTLNIVKPEGRDIVRQLIASADVVIANLPEKVLKSLGLDYATVSAINPRAIVVTNSAFGKDGPWADRIGFDGMAQAMSGAAWYSGTPGNPAKSTIHFIDYTTAMAATIGTLTALMERQQSELGQEVSTSLLGTALTLGNSSLMEQAVLKRDRIPTGNRGQVAAPADIFATADGHIIIQIAGPWMFKRLSRWLGREAWLTDPRFHDDLARGEQREYLCGAVADYCATRTNDVLLDELKTARVPAGPLLSWQEALDHPATAAVNQLQPLDYPGTPKPPPIATTPFKLSRTQVGIRHRAPLLGEHTDQILVELGYSETQVDSLRQAGVV